MFFEYHKCILNIYSMVLSFNNRNFVKALNGFGDKCIKMQASEQFAAFVFEQKNH